MQIPKGAFTNLKRNPKVHPILCTIINHHEKDPTATTRGSVHIRIVYIVPSRAKRNHHKGRGRFEHRAWAPADLTDSFDALTLSSLIFISSVSSLDCFCDKWTKENYVFPGTFCSRIVNAACTCAQTFRREYYKQVNVTRKS